MHASRETTREVGIARRQPNRNTMKPPYLIVAGNFVKSGGMDEANYEFARYLAEREFEVHLVAYNVAPDLTFHPRVTFHRAPMVAGSYLLSEPILNRVGQFNARRIVARGGRVVVNGANCAWDDVNWVHHIQCIFEPKVRAGYVWRLKEYLRRRVDLGAERRVIPRARVAITQSELNRRALINELGIPAERTHTVYLGIDTQRFRPPSRDERASSRKRFVLSQGRPLVAFVGALGDNRKGFDMLFGAWQRLCARPDWDADLIVLGRGREVPLWHARTVAAGLGSRVRFLSFNNEEDFVVQLLWACDALVLPSRYEGYGRPVQEAICCGLPALVSKASGVAEHFGREFDDLLISDPEDLDELISRLWCWRLAMGSWQDRIHRLSETLREHTWEKMSQQMLALTEMRRKGSAPRSQRSLRQ
jgi:glycosyltransferase involved in cell wall biosynthesis